MAPDLALRVPPPLTEEVMEEARDRGVYDETRSVRRVGDRTEVPVTRSFGRYETVEQDEPVRRRVSLDDYVEDPPPFDIVGDVALVRFGDASEKRESAVADALGKLHGVRAVLAHEGLEGKTRVPHTRDVAGTHDTETVHRENGFEFALDPSRVMFSAGNAAERVRMRDTVSPDERVFDMFAGIGYFAVPAAVGGAGVVAAEVRETSHGYLVENARRNGVSDRVDTRHADCREVDVTADRVIMGHFDATERTYLDHAFGCVGDGGVVHVHDAVHENAERETVRVVQEAAGRNGHDAETDVRRVKGIAEGVAHVVVDACV